MSWTSTDASLVGFAAVVQAMRKVIESQCGLAMSPKMIDHTGSTPGGLIDDTFSLDVQSENTDKYREDSVIRAGHALRVIVARRFNAADELADYIAAMRFEEEIIRALAERVATYDVGVAWRRTERTRSVGGEYLIVTITLYCEHDWYSQPLAVAS